MTKNLKAKYEFLKRVTPPSREKYIEFMEHEMSYEVKNSPFCYNNTVHYKPHGTGEMSRNELNEFLKKAFIIFFNNIKKTANKNEVEKFIQDIDPVGKINDENTNFEFLFEDIYRKYGFNSPYMQNGRFYHFTSNDLVNSSSPQEDAEVRCT